MQRYQPSTVLGLAVLTLVGLVFQRSSGQESAKAIPNQQALNRGCRDGGIANTNRVLPHYVSVHPDDRPATAEGSIRRSYISHEDFPLDHDSHDVCFLVDLAPQFAGLHSDANDIDEETGGRLMEMEWESKYLPERFWPVSGDRAWVMGRHIWDCGHAPYRTEFHPPKAIAFTRLEPHIFTGQQVPSLSNKTYIYLHGQGGYFYDPVAGQDYEFDVPLPTRPAAVAGVEPQLRTEVLDLPFGGPVPVLTPSPEQNRVRVRYPLADIQDTEPKRWNLYQQPLPPRPPIDTVRFGAVIAAGWHQPVLSVSYRRLRVTVESITVHDDHDDDANDPPGEWRLWVRVNGEWMPMRGLEHVSSGQTVAVNKKTEVIVPENGSLMIETSGWEDDCDKQFGVRTNPKLLDVIRGLECVIRPDEKLGVFKHSYTSQVNFGIGTHPTLEENPGADPDFTLRYRIEELARYTP